MHVQCASNLLSNSIVIIIYVQSIDEAVITRESVVLESGQQVTLLEQREATLRGDIEELQRLLQEKVYYPTAIGARDMYKYLYIWEDIYNYIRH